MLLVTIFSSIILNEVRILSNDFESKGNMFCKFEYFTYVQGIL